MRSAVIAFAVCTCLCVTCFPSSADIDDLSQGVIIAHYPPDFAYSAGMPWCDEYDNTYSIASCGEQNNRIDGGSTPDDRVVWYIVSAFEEDKQWAGTSFGLGGYTSTLFYFTAYGPCLADGLETSTGSWPGPNQGTTVVATTSNWEGNFQVVYHFEGYTYTSLDSHGSRGANDVWLTAP